MGVCKSCIREADEGYDYCCEACEKYKVHSPECNQRTFPMLPYAEYLNDPEATIKIVDRLSRALGFAHVLANELQVISAAGRALVPNYTSGLDSMIAHLRIDIDYCGHEARKLTGG